MQIDYPILVADGKMTPICNTQRGVYCWFNKITHKRYVGIGAGSGGLKERLSREISKEVFGAPALESAIKKYGIEQFIVYLLYEFSENADANFIGMTEKIFIQSLNSMAPNGYNLTAGGKGTLGFSIGTQSKNRGKTNVINSVKRSKTAKLLSPIGEIHHVTNIGAFSVALGFPPNALYPLTNRKAESYKGWTLANDTRESYAKRLSKVCYFFDACVGEVIKVRNLNKFCKKFDLSQASMNKVSLGSVLFYKNWKKATDIQVQTFDQAGGRFWDHDHWVDTTPKIN